MTTARLLAVAALLLIMTACYTHAPYKPLPKTANAKEGDAYSLIVSFFSIGEGIDGKAKAAFLDYITTFEHNEMTKISYEEVHWGREGEVDYCMQLQELYATQQVRFVAGLKELFKDKKLVKLEQNSPCLHKVKR